MGMQERYEVIIFDKKLREGMDLYGWLVRKVDGLTGKGRVRIAEQLEAYQESVVDKTLGESGVDLTVVLS